MTKTDSQAKPVPLHKVMRELNVAAETIVQALKDSGFELDKKLAAGNLSAKLPADMYEALFDVFQEDVDARARVVKLRNRRVEAEKAATAAAQAEPAPEPKLEVIPEPVVEVEPEPEPNLVQEEVLEEVFIEEEIEADEPELVSPEAPLDQPLAEIILEAQEDEDTESIEFEDEIESTEAEFVEQEPTDDVVEGELEIEEFPEEELDLDIPVDEDEDPENVVRADRYQLQGTRVLGKISLKDMDTSGKRKRKRKKTAAPAPEPEPEPEVEETASAKAKKPAQAKRSRKKQPKVDKEEASATLQETLQRLQQGAGRERQRRRRERRTEREAIRDREVLEAEAGEKSLRVLEYISTGELAELMGVSVTEVIQAGFQLGMMVSINQRLDADAISYLADEFGFEVEFVTDVSLDDIEIEDDDPDTLVSRSPVVTIMGHVDHGKTSLLDYIREGNVVAGEAGGITQHIGAYSVQLADDRNITFLDTPGHEAFTAMRARGAQVTDIVILVVAADDQVMPQTREAISHAKAAGVPIVVAINKIDKAGANTDKVMQQLADENVLVEQYGGNVQCEFVSAKTGQGVEDLLEKVLTEAELLELTANPDRDAVGTIIESQLDKGRGIVATVLVETGTLEVGDVFVAGQHSGRVRAMFDERDQRVDEAGPSQPVRVLGFAGPPDMGDRFVVLEEDRDAKEIAAKRQQIIREQMMRKRKHVSLDDISRRMALGELAMLRLIIKADVAGSLEALSDSLLKLSTDEVAVEIIHSGVGAINESDVMLAAASDAIIFGFQVRPMAGVRQVAEREEIDVRLYSVIYDAIEDVRDALEGLLQPVEKEKTLGMVDIRETYRIPRVGTIAGCYVLSGRIARNDKIRLIRDGVVIYNGTLASLKRFKDDVREVQSGYECGLSIHNFNDIKVGDQIEAFEVYEERRTLEK